MYYYKARIYSPTLGRFMQTDPVGYEGGLNLYAYVRNDPVNRTDPTGLIDDKEEKDKPKTIGEGAKDLVKGMGDLAGDMGELAGDMGEFAGEMAQLLGEGAELLGEGAEMLGDGATDMADALVPDSVWQSQRAEIKSAERSVGSLSFNVRDTQRKIDEYSRNPDAHDNDGRLARATTPAMRQSVIQGRIKALRGQLKKNMGELRKANERLRQLRQR